MPDIPDEYLTEIGRVNVRWSSLESIIDLCLIRLTGKRMIDQASKVIFNHMAFPMKLDVMATLVSLYLPAHPGLSGFPAVHQLLKKAQERRNAIVHGRWDVDETTGRVRVAHISARGKWKVSLVPIDIVEIREAADLIEKADQELLLLITNAGTANTPPQSGQ